MDSTKKILLRTMVSDICHVLHKAMNIYFVHITHFQKEIIGISVSYN